MAIVINGSGTVTGISVGGLPDGIVDAGTLATNSVDSAELIDGSIDTAHIGTDQITSAILPAGSVLQVVTNTYATETTTTSGTFQSCGFSCDITPSATSSKILCLVFIAAAFTLTTDEINLITLYRDSTNLGTGGGDTTSTYDNFAMSYQDTTTEGGAGQGFSVLDSPSTTSAITYTPKFGSRDGDTVYVQVWGQTSTITLLEIAG